MPEKISVSGLLNGEAWEQEVSLIEDLRIGAGFIPRFWAQRHLEELLKDGEEHRAEIVRLSKKYYVATPFTSLIVLEDDAMYEEYEVEKGRKDHWAAYPAPDEIPVVREPMRWYPRGWGRAPEVAETEVLLDPKTIEEILNTLLPEPSEIGMTPWAWGGQEWGVSYFYYESGLWDGSLNTPMWANDFGVNGFDRGGMGGGGFLLSGSQRERFRMGDPMVFSGGSLRGARLPLSSRGVDKALFGRQSLTSGSGGQGRFGTYNRRGLAAHVVDVDGEIRFESKKTRPSVRYLGGFGPYIPPIAPTYRPALRLSLIPALAIGESDRASAVEMKLGREMLGSVTAEAADLILAAETQRKPVRIGETVTAPDGRSKSSVTTPMFLEQESVSDGKEWFHIYRELGFAMRRSVTPTNLNIIQSAVPHWPPGLKELEARWVVTLGEQGDGWFEIVLTDPDDDDARQILRISDVGRLLASKQFDGDKLVVEISFSYEGDTVTMVDQRDNRSSYEAVEVEVSDAMFDTDLGDLVIIDMPLRKSVFYRKQLEQVQEDDVEKRKRLLSHLALAQAFDPTQVTLTAPEQTEWKKLSEGDPELSKFISLWNSGATGFEDSSRFLKHQDLVSQMLTGKNSEEFLENFIRDWPESPFIIDLINYSGIYKRAWIQLLDSPRYQVEAIRQVALNAERLVWLDADYLKGRVLSLLVESAESGEPMVVADPVAGFIGEKAFGELVVAYRTAAEGELDRGARFAVLDLALQAKEADLERDLLDDLLEGARPEELVRLAEIFDHRQRPEMVLKFYKQAIGESDDPGAVLLEQASEAIRAADEKLSIDWAVLALEKLSVADAAVDRYALQNRYVTLVERALQSDDIDAAERLAIGADLDVGISGQHVILEVAKHYSESGDDAESWRWISTLLDRHPKDSKTLGAIARWYELQGDLDQADKWFAAAHAADSATPEWLKNRARVLYAKGEFEQGDEVFRELIDTKWAPALQRMVPSNIDIVLSKTNEHGMSTTEVPGEGWTGVDFDDGDWEHGRTQFTGGASDIERLKEPIYVRRKLRLEHLPRRGLVNLRINDVKCDIYVNGKLLTRARDARGGGKNVQNQQLTLSQEVLDALVVGENVIAFRCEKIGENPQFSIDLWQRIGRPR